MWNQTGVTQLLGITYPIVQAGMAGVSSPSIVAEVSNAGCLGTLGASYMSPQDITSAIKDIQALTDKPFAVNLFVTQRAIVFSPELQKMQTELAPFRIELELTEPDAIDFEWYDLTQQVQAVVDAGVKIISFTFGIPSADIVTMLHEAGVTIIGTATTVKEAVMIEDAGFHIVVAQGMEAGGHRASFASEDELAVQVGLMSLVPQMVDQVGVPVIAAGGIMDGRSIVAALALGAQGVQLGSAFLLTDESSAVEAYKKALLDTNDESTIVTKLFSGKPARVIANRFTKVLHSLEDNVPAFPLQNTLTSDIRKMAAVVGDTDLMSLYAGQSSCLGRELSARELIDTLVSEVATNQFQYHDASDQN